MDVGKRDRIAFVAVTTFAVVMYTIPSEWIPALEPLRLAFISSVLAASFVVIRRLAKREPFSFDGVRGFAVIAFGLLAYASVSWSVNPEVSSRHGIEILKLVAIYLVMVNVITTPKRLVVFAGAMVFASMVTSWHVIDWYLRGEDLIEGFRARWLGVYADPNHMAMNLGLVVPLGIAFVVRKANPWVIRILGGVAAGLAVTAIVYSHSRGGFIGLVVAMTLWIFLERSRRLTTLILGAALTIALLVFAPKSFWDRNETVTHFTEDASAMGRVYAWEVASEMSMSNPIIGVGAGGFRYAWPLYAPPEATTAFVAHNVYLDVVGELGFLGLLLFLMFTGGAAGGAFAATQSREIGWMANAIVGAVAGYIVCNMFSGYTLSAHFYVLFGLAASAERVLRLCAGTVTEPQTRQSVRPEPAFTRQAWEG